MSKINDKNSAIHQIFLEVEKFRLGVKWWHISTGFM
jgi:hypothetical protein